MALRPVSAHRGLQVRTLLWSAALWGLFALTGDFAPGRWGLWLAGLLGLLLGASLGKVPGKALLRALCLPWLMLGPMLAFVLLVPAPERTLAFADTARWVIRGALLSSSLLLLSQQCSWTELLAPLSRYPKLRPLVMLLGLAFRHMSTLGRDLLQLLRVAALRGGLEGISSKLRTLRALLIRGSLLALSRADRVAEALALRGWQGELLAVNYIPNARDYALIAGAVGISLLAFAQWMVYR